jgi:CRISPR/Cas system-associated exonuclease Cas4 (RecB family)
MADPVARRLRELLDDPAATAALLAAEKRRRHVPNDQLVFVGVADAADYWWCGMRAVLRAKAKELAYFTVYLSDRVTYARRLGIGPTAVDTDEHLLGIGSEISLEDVNRLLREGRPRQKEQRERKARLQVLAEKRVDSWGNPGFVINPLVPPDERRRLEDALVRKGKRVIDLEADPKLRGRVFQETMAQSYPTIRWNFAWGPYVVVGVPDGITDDFVFELKTTARRFLEHYVKPVAFAQADLYGFFFQRKTKRVELRIEEQQRTVTVDAEVDSASAVRTLQEFQKVDEGADPESPVTWKCKKCEFRATCPICPLKPSTLAGDRRPT